MSDDVLSMLKRLALALFPDATRVPATAFISPLSLADHSSPRIQRSFRRIDGVEVARIDGIESQGAFRGSYLCARLPIHIPCLDLDPGRLEAEEAGQQTLNPTTRELLSHPEVAAAMVSSTLWANSSRLALLDEGGVSRNDAVALVLALERARREPWESLARARSLTMDDRALSIFGTTGGLRGTRENIDIRIREERGFTRIRVALPPGLPESLSIQPGSADSPERVGDPILDRRLAFRGLTSGLKKALRECRDPLMHLLADRGESDIDSRRIRIVLPGRALTSLAALVDDAIAVHRALRSNA